MQVQRCRDQRKSKVVWNWQFQVFSIERNISYFACFAAQNWELKQTQIVEDSSYQIYTSLLSDGNDESFYSLESI